MKEVLINLNEAQAAEIHPNGSVCVTMAGEDANGNPRRWTSKPGQYCDFDAIYDRMTVLRGEQEEGNDDDQ